MRKIVLGFLCLAAVGTTAAARADTYPPTTELIGEVSQSVVSNQCYIVRGDSQFLRYANHKGFITIPEMTVAGYQLNGRITLSFSSATGGTVLTNYATDYPTTIQTASFTNYNQTYNANAKSLNVRFKLVFPNCTLPVTAVFATP